jgi:hypothetical protein
VNFKISWSDEDQEWVGTCDEYPSLSWLDADWQKALDGISELSYAARDDIAAGRRCEVQECSATVTHNVDGDQLCAGHFDEHWAHK